ncbi:MAG: flagella basal body P-ring formation protein FlgA [Myxococcota bacterium]|jgi:flagella basal body P-ring formation protein FlgA
MIQTKQHRRRVFATTLGLLVLSSAWPVSASQPTTALSLSDRVHAEVDELLRKHASGRVNRFDIPALDSFDALGFAPADIDIRVRTRLNGELYGRVPVTVILSRGEHEVRRSVVTASLLSITSVLVASRSLGRGEVVQEGDFRRERRDVSVLRGGVITRESQLVGMRVRSSVKAGRIWQTRHLESMPTVKRGEQVRLRLITGGLQIDGSGKAGEDGRAGDWIRVLNAASMRYVTGQVDEEGTVYVRF